MKYAVIYQSKSGNTRLIAEKIYGALNTEDKTIVDIDTEDYASSMVIGHDTCGGCLSDRVWNSWLFLQHGYLRCI